MKEYEVPRYIVTDGNECATDNSTGRRTCDFIEWLSDGRVWCDYFYEELYSNDNNRGMLRCHYCVEDFPD